MPLDEASRRFAFLLQRDLRRLAERREEHAARGEEMTFDAVSQIAMIQTRDGDPVARLYGEVLGTYAPHDRILRWAWAGRSSSALPTHGDAVFREGQSRGVPQLSMSVVGELDPEDATLLVSLGALVARADSVHERKVSGGEIEFVGIFDRPRPSESIDGETRYSVPPPPADRSTEPKGAGPARAYRSVPPIQEIFEPRSGAARARGEGASPPPPDARPSGGWSPRLPGAGAAPVARPLQEPSRALFLPVANAALVALARHGKNYLQGLFVVTLDHAPHERDPAESQRIVVQLVLIDGAGILRALDPPAELVEASAAMVDADRREGNGQWRKLSARITPKPDGGASLHVDVT